MGCGLTRLVAIGVNAIESPNWYQESIDLGFYRKLAF
jgi:hypothetical protein